MNNWLKENWFKIVAAVVLFVGMGHHPYSYYQFLHWVASASAFYAAYRSHHAKHSAWFLIFIIIGILFNPIIPFYLAQSTWQRWDFLAGAIFIIGAIFEKTPV
jgi:MFS family permease